MEKFKYSFKATNSAALALEVYNVGFQKCAGGYGWGPGVRDHYLIHYVVSGRGRLELHGQTYSIGPATAFLIPPDSPVYYVADETDPWEYYWVGFSGASAKVLLAATPFAHSPHVDWEGGDSLRQTLLDIYKVRGSDYQSAVQMAGYLQVALGRLMVEGTEQGQGGLTGYARRGAEVMAQNYSHPITVDQVAAQVGVSRSYLYRGFLAQFGMSPRDYLAKYRMERACQLLRHSGLSVQAVATSVGFEDAFYFSRAFHRAMGASPKAYRETELVTKL